jgi:hypothetical protein
MKTILSIIAILTWIAIGNHLAADGVKKIAEKQENYSQAVAFYFKEAR